MNKILWRMSCFAAALSAMAAGQETHGQTNAAATGNWSTPGTWDNGLPDVAKAAFVNGGRTVTVSNSGNVTNQLDIGTIAGQTGGVSVTGGDLTIFDADGVTEPNLPSIRLGVVAGSTGNFTLSDGLVYIDGANPSGFAVGDLLVGDNGDGNFTMTGGELNALDEIVIGTQTTSTGVATISGGNFHTSGRSILVGFNGNGTLNVSGTATVTANFDMLLGFGQGSVAHYNQSGGTVTAGLLFTNFRPSGDPSADTVVMTQTGGVFNTRIAYVLGQGEGTTTMNHSGGTINAMQGNGDFVVSDGGGNTTTYNLSGSAQVNASGNVIIGTFEGANGTINQTGGTLTAVNNLRIGADGVGAWNLSAGTVNTKNIFLGDFDSSFGTMKVSGGVLNLSGDLNVGGALASNAPPVPGRLEPSEANGPQGQALDANGTFIVQGTAGDINVSGNLLANPADKAAFRNGPGQQNDSILRFTLGTTGISTITVGGIADLDGAVIDIDDAANYFAANPSASLTLIDAAGGFGNVFTATTAEAAGNGRGFSFAAGDAALYSLAIQPSGGGEKLVLTKLAGGGLAADFNHDGAVNSLDLTIWKGAYGSTVAGDANNDGRTDGADFLIWQRQFGTTPAAPAAAAVPEPASGALIAIGLAGLAGLRRRK
ncbi:beta strand repeat-containing protein [Lacipirellula sp.]|uniref:beta strand repeat-containing protein n=1 Tax=Lacipirellula sp. TaxID=2691419 RepID=UPI003D0DAEFA